MPLEWPTAGSTLGGERLYPSSRPPRPGRGAARFLLEGGKSRTATSGPVGR